ncbi:antibiotic biosynthesis monooxygenase family protein [Actinokineospora diospyrosa]|uniref:Heme-degrading monooxygenase HmoA n=1 Tax=Actinokineospora diospyrosa TaxID=103728 RepID=A0ABT1IP71_9PSEU|nr:antibiotic biosynthesis monooxygenase [Actinokineospora diospyrosa]MCP2274339.1 Heme-degrading monooxygenase HmoA [Actinokineospora diospyrosa]
MHLTTTPAPPYYAVIFTSILSPQDAGYHEASDRMFELVATSPGFLGYDSVRDTDRIGITVAYFKDEASIATWRDQPEHVTTRHRGRTEWYEAFQVRVARVERAYGSPT